MFQQKINKDTILHYGSMLLGAAVLSFGLFNVHSQSKITEGGFFTQRGKKSNEMYDLA